MKKTKKIITMIGLSLFGMFLGGSSVYADIPINSETFPDETFRSIIIDNYDIDDSESLSEYEINNVTDINASGNGIKSLIGIKHFTQLEHLNIQLNQLSILDLRGLDHLKYLDADYNQLTELNVSGLKNLEYIRASNNQLNTLDVSDLEHLQELYVYDNLLTDLKVKGLSRLRGLTASNNQLTSLDASDLVSLEQLIINNNQLNNLNLNNLSNLQLLIAENNCLNALDLNKNNNLLYASITPQIISGPVTYNTDGKWQVDLSQIGLTDSLLQNVAITTADVDNSSISKIAIFNNATDPSLPPTELNYEYNTQNPQVDTKMSVTVNLTVNYLVSFNTDYNGILVNGESQSLEINSTLNIIPTPVANNGYEFSHWVNLEGTKYSSEELASLTVTANEVFTAIFKKTEAVTDNKNNDSGKNSTNENEKNGDAIKKINNKELPKTGAITNLSLTLIGGIIVLLVSGLRFIRLNK